MDKEQSGKWRHPTNILITPKPDYNEYFIGNKAKGDISKLVLQETKHAKFSEKTDAYAHGRFIYIMKNMISMLHGTLMQISKSPYILDFI